MVSLLCILVTEMHTAASFYYHKCVKSRRDIQARISHGRVDIKAQSTSKIERKIPKLCRSEVHDSQLMPLAITI